MSNSIKNKPNTNGKNSLFDILERNFRMDSWFESGVPTKYFMHILFITGLGLVYIGNTHYADRLSRKESKLKRDVNDLRADYTTLKADYMYESKQSEVAKKVEYLNLKEGGRAPYKVLVTTEKNGH